MAVNLNMKLSIPKKLAMPNDPIRILNWVLVIGIIAYVGYLTFFLYSKLFTIVYLPEAIDSSQVVSNKESVDKRLLEKVLDADAIRTTPPPVTATRNPFLE